MTKFEPEVAYRILKARQDRLYDEAATLWNSAEFGYSRAGELANYLEYLNWREYISSLSRAVLMEDALDYLRNRIEEERNDAI